MLVPFETPHRSKMQTCTGYSGRLLYTYPDLHYAHGYSVLQYDDEDVTLAAVGPCSHWGPGFS
jgi:hypothetical protein